MNGCRKFVIFFVVIILLALLAGAGAFIWYNQQIYSPAGTSDEIVKFTIQTGESTDTIAQNLVNNKLINNKDAFVFYVRLNKLGDDFKAGEFELKQTQTSAAIAQQLTVSPIKETIDFTIKEGLRYSEILTDLKTQFADKATNMDFDLLAQIFASPDQFSTQFKPATQQFLKDFKPAGKSLEGFLFPDTYEVYADTTAIDLVDLLVGTLAQKLTATDRQNIAASGHTFYQILIIASITEREANTLTDYPIVAGIFYKRLSLGMKLESDVTTLYGLNRRKPEPTRSELADASNKYNTRILSGYTPTPIANPGIATIRAAIKPQQTDYLFFIAGNDGKVYYAKTLAEHNRNIRDHL